MQKIALTGNIGAGKSTVADMLAQMGFLVISADKLAQQVIAPPPLLSKAGVSKQVGSSTPRSAYEQLLQLVGPKYLTKEGVFDRPRLAQKIFQQKELLEQVEAVIHPQVWDLIKHEEHKAYLKGIPVIIVEIPLLFEKKLEHFFNISVLVATDTAQQKSRLKKNRHLSLKDIINRIQLQIPQEEKIKQADYVIWNNSSLQELKNQVIHFVQQTGLKK